ncbi:hypothetical protein CDAR_299571 [Caerostris darwini]|uniref:Uncharacterized protein n=1 Tax=Caerostris darwini TaxID=1538125 RepID=A0AAV4RPN3_9ARAC|nr:hypothetical protein CDAR_299571 [Caerostris darwini]
MAGVGIINPLVEKSSVGESALGKPARFLAWSFLWRGEGGGGRGTRLIVCGDFNGNGMPPRGRDELRRQFAVTRYKLRGVDGKSFGQLMNVAYEEMK